jgi:iron complex transport system substrate-binding protein
MMGNRDKFFALGERLMGSILFLLMILIPVTASAATVTDAGGRVLEIERPFARIISLYAAHTENLASLGLDREIVGIAAGDDHPPGLMARPRFSYREDAEKFIAARPDLVLVRPMIERSYPQLIGQLERAGITVVSLQPTSMAEIFSYWRQLGALTGRQEQAEAMVEAFGEELARIRARVEEIAPENRKRVYFEAIHDKMKTFAPESIAMFVLEQAGGINAAADAAQVRKTNIAFYGKERILAKGGEIDLYLAQRGRMNPVTVAGILAEPGYGAIKAVREQEVHLIDERIVSRPTLRILEGVRTVAAILYPELFPEGRQ